MAWEDDYDYYDPEDFTKVYNEFQEKVESQNHYKVIATDKLVLGVIG